MVRVMNATRMAQARHETAHASYCSTIGGRIEWLGLTPRRPRSVCPRAW